MLRHVPLGQAQLRQSNLLTEAGFGARDFTAFLLGASAGAGAAVLAAQIGGFGSPAPERLASRLRLKQASKLLSVGPPDRVITGSGCEVVQHLLDYTWPGIGNVLAIALRRRLAIVIENLDSQTIDNIVVDDLSFGEAAPTVLAVKLYSTDPDKVIIDAEVNWETFDSRLRLQVQLKETLGTQLLVPVEVTQLRYQGVLRIIMTPLLDRAPFFGSMAFTTCSEPELSFSLKVLGGEVSAIPGLRQALRDAGVDALKRTFVWPRRILLPLKRAKGLEFLDTVLPLDEIEKLRTLEYEDLEDGRVRSWGNPARTRRVTSLMEGRRQDRKRPLSRVLTATRSVATAGWEGAKSRVKRVGASLRWALGVEATPAADAQPPSISDASTSTSSVEDGAKRLESAAVEVVQELGEAAAAPAAAQEPPQPPRKRWIARVWKALRRVRGRAKARAAAAARAATAAAAALAVVVESAESPESADAAAAFDDDELDHADELLEGTAAAAAATAADPDHPASAPEPRFEEVFSVRGSLIRGFRNAGNGDV